MAATESRRAKTFDRTVAVLTLAATVAVGILIPLRLDAQTRARASDQICTTSISTLRTALITLKEGYYVGPFDKVQRLADWSVAIGAIDSTNSDCEQLSVQQQALWRSFSGLRATAHKEDSLAFDGTWNDVNTLALIAWTDSAVADISQD